MEAGFQLKDGFRYYKSGTTVTFGVFYPYAKIVTYSFESTSRVPSITPEFIGDTGREAMRIFLNNVKAVKALDDLRREIDLMHFR